MATITQSNTDNFLTWQKVNGTLTLAELQADGLPDVKDNTIDNFFEFSTNWNDATANDGAYSLVIGSTSTKYDWYIDGVLRSESSKTLSVPADSGWLDGTTKAIRIVSDDFNLVTSLSWQSKKLTSTFPSISIFTSLLALYLFDNNLSGSVPSFAGLPLTDIRIYDNSFSGSIPSLVDQPNLSLFWAYGNSLTGDIPDLSINKLNSGFKVQDNLLTGWIVSTFNVQLKIMDVSGNAIPSSSINNALIGLDNAGAFSGTFDSSGGTNGAPTGSGTTAVTSLQGKAWTVTTN